MVGSVTGRGSRSWFSHPLRTHHVNIRFQDTDGNEWIAIWKTRVQFGKSTEFNPNQPIRMGILFCNLKTREERFLALPEAEIPSEEHLEERGKEETLREMLGRAD